MRLFVANILILLIPQIVLASKTIELFEDPGFERGFSVLKAVPNKRIQSGLIAPTKGKVVPVWELAQWGSHFEFANSQRKKISSNTIQFQGATKKIVFGDMGSSRSTLIFDIDTRKEYNGKLRKLGEHWPHLLVEQRFKKHPKITELKNLDYGIDYKIIKSKAFKQEGWNDSLHTAQFLAFLTIQNRNKKSKGFGDYLWFGIPMYDARYKFPRSHKSLDKGTGKFIYTLGENQFTDQISGSGKWIAIRSDLLPLIYEGLETAWENGFLKDSRNFSDYEIRAFNIGWEITGIYHVTSIIRNLNLEATMK